VTTPEHLAEERPEVDPLFLGLARPVMFLGVPRPYFLACITVVTMLFLHTSLLTYLFFLPLHVFGYLASLSDPRRLEVWLACFAKTRRTPNRDFWGADSYQP